MKKIILIFGSAFLITIGQTKAQFHGIKGVCENINQDSTDKAVDRFAGLKDVPTLNNKEVKYYISYFFTKYYLESQEQLKAVTIHEDDDEANKKIVQEKEKEIKNFLDTIKLIYLLHQTMPENGFFARNTKKKLSKQCPCIDMEGKCFVKLIGRYEEALAELKWLDDFLTKKITEKLVSEKVNASVDRIVDDAVREIVGRFNAEQDSVLSILYKLQNDMEETDQVIGKYKIMLKETLKKLALKDSTDTGKMSKGKIPKPKSVESREVFLDFKIHSFDSIEFEVYMASKVASKSRSVITQTHGIAEYCNKEVNSIVANAAYETIKKWFVLSKSDTLSISATVIGEADDTWMYEDKKHPFVESDDCKGIGSKLGLKDGDRISNDTIALLRTLSAEMYLREGAKKAVSEKSAKKNAHVEIKVVGSYRNWMEDPGIQKDPEFRKKVIILKCNNCR